MHRSCAAALLVTLAAGVSDTHAADPITISTSTGAELPLNDAPAQDWAGFYAGIFGAVQLSPEAGDQIGMGVVLGANLDLDQVLAGAEMAITGLASDASTTSYAQILGRAGLMVNDDVGIYTAAGYGIDIGAPEEEDFLVGGGLQFAITDDLSVRAQYLRGVPLSGDNPKNQFTLGANFHF